MNKIKRTTVADIKACKGDTPLVCLTAYTAPIARILDRHVNILLVGDSLGMVLYGMENTLGVTLDLMINHGRTVVNASEKACVVVDMPFASYQKNKEQAYENAAHVMAETGCTAVKLEGGEEMAETVQFLVERGIAVMGHVGLLPQSVNALGGYGYRGKTDEEYSKILAGAKAIEHAGAFSLVLEGVTETLAKEITAAVAIPTIGIGASPACDGQVLVTEDMLGLLDSPPKFVKQYATLGGKIEEAVGRFASDVRTRRFPASEHLYGVKNKKKAG